MDLWRMCGCSASVVVVSEPHLMVTNWWGREERENKREVTISVESNLDSHKAVKGHRKRKELEYEEEENSKHA